MHTYCASSCLYADCQLGGICLTRGGTHYMYYVYTVNECVSHRLSWYVSAYTTKTVVCRHTFKKFKVI
jgi:hypothetical protein